MVYHGPVLFFCTEPSTAGTSSCLSVSLSVSQPASPQGAAVLKHPSRQDPKLWQGLSRSLKDGKWRCETSRMWWGRIDFEKVASLIEAASLPWGIVIVPSSFNNSHRRRSLRATSCLETRLSELHTYAMWTLRHSVLCRRTQCILTWKICRDFSLFFWGRA